LIWKTYVQVVLPDTFTGKTAPVYWSGDDQRRIGYLLLKKIEVEIGGQIIDTHDGEWLFLWECLTANFDTSVKLDSMVGGLYNGTYTTSTSCGGRPAVLYIPLQFWFNRNPGLALPLIALQYHEVRFNITLEDSINLVEGATTGAASLAAAARAAEISSRAPASAVSRSATFLSASAAALDRDWAELSRTSASRGSCGPGS
jgi:hypothetical protein